MVSILVPFPDDLHGKAELAAREQGLALDEFVRQCVITTVSKPRTSDTLFADRAVFSGEAPRDLAENHDAYLYGERQ